MCKITWAPYPPLSLESAGALEVLKHSPESLGKVYIGFSVVPLLVEHLRLMSVTFRLPLMTVLSDFQLLCMN